MKSFKRMAYALAKWHNAKIRIHSDVQFGAPVDTAWRWIDFVDTDGSDVVFSGGGCIGNEEDGFKEFLKVYVGKERYMRFFGECSGKHNILIDAFSINELQLKMAAMGII